MRWERLFADLEAQALDDAALERDALVEELVDEEWASVGSRDVLWGEVVIEVLGAGRIDGVVTQSLADLLVVESAGCEDVVVSRAAVVGWRGGRGRAPALTPVTGRLGWAHVWRALRDEGSEARVARVDGAHVVGQVGAVIADAVLLEGPSGRTWLPWSAIATVRSG
ncbi:hypothetical protein [Aeromicrobium sp. Leaf350]|uniref:hypothetical protein n=1 Tax=Aeromicrobium sp. Leaf350 TaxID=2876565 RepID=UPI001E415546|nr:hypothetical protein [Aeromicrobium sp. Leaf350]